MCGLDRRLVLVCAWGALQFGLVATMAAEVIVRVPQDVATIQAAIDTVPDGATIEIAAGTYVPPVTTGFLIQNGCRSSGRILDIA